MKINTLPDKPSELIRLAISDLKKAEKNPKFKIEMSSWYEIKGNDVCYVCFAGAVMANTLKIGKLQFIKAEPDNFDNSIRNKLNALDSFRSGNILEALIEMEIDLTNEQDKKIRTYEDEIYRNDLVPYYESNPKNFKKAMLEISSKLEECGL